MSSENRKERFQEQAERNIDAAALRAARSVQAPGQTPEQTKLVAQGIAKGIALYRKQQNEKAREQNRQRKRALKQRERMLTDDPQDEPTLSEGGENMRAAITVLWIAGIVFALVAVLHVLRWALGVSVIISGWTMPVGWSLPGAVLAAALAGACFWAGRSLCARHRTDLSGASGRSPIDV
jgi:Flp pilus assembly protein TadB